MISERIAPQPELESEPDRSARPIAIRPSAAREASVPIWVLAAQAGTCSSEERAEFAGSVLPAIEGRSDRLLLVTCHRAELIGMGQPPDRPERLRLSGDAGLEARLRLLVGDEAARHIFRLAAGLESAIVGEDQVLHQVRELRRAARESHGLDPHLSRLLEVALGLGRRARAARFGDAGAAAGAIAADAASSPARWSLAGRALDWLAERGVAMDGARLLVAGAGEMGQLVALEAHRRGASTVVASRSRRRAADLAGHLGADSTDLAEATRYLPEVDALVVALAGPWNEAAAAGVALPPTVDLSAPGALPDGLASDQLDIDGLYRWASGGSRSVAAQRYVEATAPLVEETLDRFARWCAGRASTGTLRALRERAESSRSQELERLLRRLPDLPPRSQMLVEAFSEQLVATILHEPTVALREDVDGSAAEAARRLFDV